MLSGKIPLLKNKVQICKNGLIMALKSELTMFILNLFTSHEYLFALFLDGVFTIFKQPVRGAYLFSRKFD